MDNPSLLSLFWTLADGNDEQRLSTSLQLTKLLKHKQEKNEKPGEEILYAVKRLVKGLASSRKFARLGYSTALSRILRDFECISVAVVLSAIKDELKIEKSLSKGEKSSVILGQMLAYLSIIRTAKVNETQCRPTDLARLIEAIVDIHSRKSPLHNLCTEALKILTYQTNGKQFSNSVWPPLRNMLSCGWEACTADHLLLLIAAHRIHEDVVDKCYLVKYWQCKKLLAEENVGKIAAIVVKSTSDHPIIHPVSRDLLAFANKDKGLKSVWEQIFNGHILETKKDSAGLLYLDTLPHAVELASTSDTLKGVLSEKTIDFLLRQLSNKKLVLHKAAKQAIAQLLPLMTSVEGTLQCDMVMCFLQSSAGVQFDSITHTNTVANLIRHMSASAAESFASILMEVITVKTVICHKDTSFNETCKFAIGQLSHMVSLPSMATNSDWQLRILHFLCLHSHFTVVKVNKHIAHCGQIPETDISPGLRKTMQDCFHHALSKLSTFQPEKGNKTAYLHLLRNVVKYLQKLLENPKSVQHVKPFAKNTKRDWDRVLDVTQKISLQSDSSKSFTENLAFELAFLQMALELLTDPEGASEVLQDLFVCHEKAFETKKKANKKKTDDEPEWIEVLTELLLSLLSRSSQLMRSVVNTMFGVICPSLTPDALQLILQSIQSSGNDEGPLDFEEDDDDEDMQVENDEDDSSESKESGFSSAESESDASDESEADDVSDVDERLKANVKAALGSAAVASDAESEADLSDGEMEKLDDVLGAAFRTMRKKKKEGKEKTVQIKNYKMRCLELLDILIQNDVTDIKFLLSMLEPLILLMDEAQKDKDQRDLQERAHKVFRNLLKAKHVCPSGVTEIPEKIEHFIQLSTKVTGIPMVTEVAHAITLMAKVMVSTDSSQQKSSTEKSNSKQVKKLGKIIKKALLNFCQKRDTLMNYPLFHTIFTSMPSLLWPLLDDLLEAAVDPQMRVFRRTQVCGMIATAINKHSVVEMGEDNWKSTAGGILNIFVKILHDATQEKDLKKKFIREILSVIHKVLNVSDYEIIKDLESPLVEKINFIQTKSKDNKDLKRMCNQLKNLLFRLNPESQTKKQINRKRKAENPPPTEDTSAKPPKTKKCKKKAKTVDTASNTKAKTRHGGNKKNEECNMDTGENTNQEETVVNGEHKPKKKKTKKHDNSQKKMSI